MKKMSKTIKIKTAKRLTAEARKQIGRIVASETIKVVNGWIREEANAGGTGIKFTHNEIRNTVTKRVKKHYFNPGSIIAKTITQYWLAGFSGGKRNTPAGIYFEISWEEEVLDANQQVSLFN
jgi:hypothetical protein